MFALLLLDAAVQTGAIVTAEDHSVLGGLGGAVCEFLSGCSPVPVLRVGVEDRFGMSGHGADLYKAYGLTAGNICAKCRTAVAAKHR